MEQSRAIRIFIVDDHTFIREAMSQLINRQPDMKVVAEAADGKAAVTSFDQVAPDVTLMDLSMPVMSGIEAVEVIKQRHPDARFIIVSAYDFPEDIQKSVQAGASAYLLKDTAREQLIHVIREVHKGNSFF